VAASPAAQQPAASTCGAVEESSAHMLCTLTAVPSRPRMRLISLQQQRTEGAKATDCGLEEGHRRQAGRAAGRAHTSSHLQAALPKPINLPCSYRRCRTCT
jgi:hypothetical protein